MLLHVHINILDNINLADIANQFVDRKDSRRGKFGHFSENYKIWSCVTFYHLLNRFLQPNDNCISTS